MNLNSKHTKSNFKLRFHYHLIITLVLIAFFNGISFGQLAINEDDSNGDVNAELDIKSTTKGVIFPVMTEAQRDAIPSPVEGLLIFNRSGGYHNCYNGSNWVQIDREVAAIATNLSAGTGTDIGVGVGVSDPDNSAILHVNSTSKGFLLPRTNANPSEVTGMIYYKTGPDYIFYFNGTDWLTILTTVSTVGAGGSGTAAGLLVGEGTIEASAKMEVRTSDDKGMLIPRMTDVQRNTIDTPLEGLTIYNTTTNEIQYYMGATWYKWSSANYSYGLVSSNPGSSCKDIYDNNSISVNVDGIYYIDPDGVGGNPEYQCTCDMTTDGGGWTLVENTGPKGSATNTTASVGSNPIPTTVGSTFSKLSDADINLIRGTYATSIVRLQRPNGNAAAFDMYFVQDRVFNSNAANGSQLQDYYTNYTDAIATTNLYSSTSPYTSALSTFSGGAGVSYYVILDFGGEGFISNLGNSQCQGSGADNRSECNALLWVK